MSLKRTFWLLFWGIAWGCTGPRSVASVPERDWSGSYVYENPGGEAGQMLLGNTFSLEIGQESRLDVTAYSMGSPHGTWQVEPQRRGDTLVVRMVAFEKGRPRDWENLKPGQALFRLVGQGPYRTEWLAMRPLYGEVGETCLCFQPL